VGAPRGGAFIPGLWTLPSDSWSSPGHVYRRPYWLLAPCVTASSQVKTGSPGPLQRSEREDVFLLPSCSSVFRSPSREPRMTPCSHGSSERTPDPPFLFSNSGRLIFSRFFLENLFLPSPLFKKRLYFPKLPSSFSLASAGLSTIARSFLMPDPLVFRLHKITAFVEPIH